MCRITTRGFELGSKKLHLMVMAMAAALLVLTAFPRPALADTDVKVGTWREMYDALEQAPSTSGVMTIRPWSVLYRAADDPDLVMHGGNVVIYMSSFILDARADGKTVGNGRILTVEGGTLTIVGDTTRITGGFTGGKADIGGAILVEGGELHLKGYTFHGCSAQKGGGIAIVGGSCTMEDSVVYGNSATQGGGVYVGPEGSLSILGGEVSDNKADLGAGIYVDGTTLTLSAGELHDNSATTGGGIYMCGGNLTLLDNVNVHGNTAAESGGNLAVDGDESAAITIAGASICEGNAADGGGVALLKGGLTLSSGAIENNAASRGAGIAVLGGTALVEDGAIRSNVGSFKGGAAYVEGGTLHVQGGSIENNSAEAGDDEWGETTTAEGGGIYVATGGSLEVEGSPSLSSNVRSGNTQDVYLESGCVVAVTGAFTPTSAVGVDVAVLPELNQTREVACEGAYGEDAFSCQAPDCEMVFESTGEGTGHALIKRVREHEGTRVSSWADLSQNLRALKEGEEASFWLEGDATYGEGQPEKYAIKTLEVRRDCKVTIDLNGYAINRDLATQDTPSDEDTERCIYVPKGTLIIRDSRGGGRICGGCCQRGGGVFVSEGTLVLEGGSITGNKATYGGGVYVGMGTFQMSGGRIYENEGLAQKLPCGGGVYVGDNSNMPGYKLSEAPQASMTMNGGSIDTNKAAGWGAGVCVSNGVLSLEEGTVSGNVRLDDADQGGGGLYIASYSQATIASGTISDNQLSGKEGAGISIKDHSTAVLSGGTISSNTCSWDGGGVCVENSDLQVCGVTITNNRSSSSGGGMVLQSGTTCSITSGSISNNLSGIDGGGVMVHYGADCTMSGGEVTGNSTWGNSTQDGGIQTMQLGAQDESSGLGGPFPKGGAFDVKGKLTVSGGSITSNYSLVGGGICFDCDGWPDKKAQVMLTGSPSITGNCAAQWYPDDLCDMTIFMEWNKDESALLTIEGTYDPPQPLMIEKAYRDKWDSIALVDKGDYSVGAFKSAQAWDMDTQTSPYELVMKDGTLYAQRQTQAREARVDANDAKQSGRTAIKLPTTGDEPVGGVLACLVAGALALFVSPRAVGKRG